MSLIVGVHGIAKQQLGRRTMRQTWQVALGDGMERAGMPREAPEPDLDMAFYGDLFLSTNSVGTKGKGPGLDDWLLADLDEEEAAELAELATLDLPEEDFDDAEADLEDATAKGHTRVPKPLQATLRVIDRRFWPSAGVLHRSSTPPLGQRR